MGNQTNTELWAVQERLRAIERAAFWRGWVNRKDLSALYGVSMAQASSDLQKYQELNPTALRYNLKVKSYEGTREMVCVLQEPRLEEAMAAFLDGAATVSGMIRADLEEGSVKKSHVAVVGLPERRAQATVERAVFLTVIQRGKIRVRYWSVNSATAKWRWMAPHAFGHDGYRWHVRAWCFENGDYRDFVLGRIEKVEWSEPLEETLPADAAWTTWETLIVRPHPALSANQQRALELDYRMRQGRLKLRVRVAMANYLRAHLGLPLAGSELPVHFEECPD